MIQLVEEDRSSAFIRKKHAGIFRSAERIWDLVFPLIQNAQSLPANGSHPWVLWVVLAYYVRQLRCFRAIILLLERGLVPEAQKILRPMMETHLHLDFLVNAEDPVTTARRYLLWESANDEKLAGILKFGDKKELEDAVRQLRDLLSAEKKQLGSDGWRTFLRYGPPMLRTDELAQKQSLGRWYDTVY